MDWDNGEVLAMTDRRVGNGIVLKGEIYNWSFDNDDEEKIQKISENLYFIGGVMADLSDVFLALLKDLQDQPPSMIIEEAKNFDRTRFMNQDGKVIHDIAIILGLHDDGKPFVLNLLVDGTHSLKKDTQGWNVQMIGGQPGTQSKAAEYFLDRLKEYGQFTPAMSKTMMYTASIDEWISADFDLIHIKAKDKSTFEQWHKSKLIA